MKEILLIDNYDSFTFNVAEQLRRLVADSSLYVRVVKNDEITESDLLQSPPAAVVISPGPGCEHDGGISLKAIALCHKMSIPLLGVCLGHQLIAHYFGGKIVKAHRPVHGEAWRILHNGRGIFSELPSSLMMMRYHSLAVCMDTLPVELRIGAWTAEGEVMSLRHKSLPMFGVQFHPESFLSENGDRVVNNFLSSIPEFILTAKQAKAC